MIQVATATWMTKANCGPTRGESRVSGDLLLGVDIGTYSAKGVLCAPGGEVLAEATIEHGLSLPRPGWAEHDADAIWWGEFAGLTRRCLRQFQRRGRRRRGGQCHRRLPASGRCRRAAAATRDPLRHRHPCLGEIVWLNERFGEEPMFDLGGMALTSQAIGPKILWIQRREPAVFAAAQMFLGSSSYMIYRLTGEYVMDYHTASYYNPLFDLRHLRWMSDSPGRSSSWIDCRN